MGGLGSVGTDNQGWFASMLAEAVRSAGGVEIRDLEIISGDWLWTKLYVDALSEGFWADFEGAVGGRGSVMRVPRTSIQPPACHASAFFRCQKRESEPLLGIDSCMND